MSVSMIITAYERGPLLERSLKALGDLTPPDEIIVIDDGSYTRGVRQAVENAPSHLNIEYVYNNRPGSQNPCQPRNVALKMAQGDEILVTEPEILFVTDVVAQLLNARTLYPDGLLHESWCFHEPRSGVSLEDCDRVPGFYAHLIRKDWLMEVGGWDEAMPGAWGWDDILLYGRLSYNGHQRVGLEGILLRHQWHESRVEPAVENEAYARSREYPRDLVANAGQEWGRILT